MSDQISVPLKARLRVVREKAGVSKAAMCLAYPMSISRLNDWENGTYTPSSAKLKRFAEVLVDKSDLRLEVILDFLGVDMADQSPVDKKHERRRSERRHMPKKGSGCTMGEITLRAA